MVLNFIVCPCTRCFVAMIVGIVRLLCMSCSVMVSGFVLMFVGI